MNALKISAVLIVLCLYVLTVPAWASAENDPLPVTPPFLTEQYIREPVFDCNTYICRAGNKNRQTIVLVHGVGGEASTTWHDIMAYLSEQYHVVAFDLPGFGRSEKPNALYSPEHYGQFINWLIKQEAPEPVILIGHSLGAALALHYAATYPETVRQLIVVDAATILHRIAISKSFVHIEEPEPSRKGLAGLIQKPFEKPLHALNHLAGTTVENLEFHKSEESIEAIVGYKGLRKLLLGGNPQAIASLAMVQENFTEHLDSITVPTSIIWGRSDDIAPLRTGKLLAGKLPVSRLRIIDNAGHVPMKEAPEVFKQILLEEISAPPAAAAPKNFSENSPQSVRCDRQTDVVFSGRFDQIIVNGCRRVLIKNATANYIEITKSEVIIEDSRVHGSEVALDLVRSKIIGTNVDLAGETAIHASGSRLDLAGAQLTGTKTAFFSADKTVVLFSVSKVNSPYTNDNLHGLYRLDAEHKL